MKVNVTAADALAAAGGVPAERALLRTAAAPAAAADDDQLAAAQHANAVRSVRVGIALVVGGLVAIGLFCTACFLAVHLTSDHTVDFRKPAVSPVNGTTIFAVFFVGAAAIERLLEPLADLLPDKSALASDAQTALGKAGAAVAGDHAAGRSAADALEAASRTAATGRLWVYGQTVGFWLLASAVGAVAAAILKLYLPYVVGIAQGGRAIQIVVTGLIIGSGTKPLHDLVGYLSAAKDAKSSA